MYQKITDLDISPGVVCWRWPTSKLIEAAIRNHAGKLLHHLTFSVRTAHTGRSPKDRFTQNEEVTHNSVFWGEINQPIDNQCFSLLLEHAN